VIAMIVVGVVFGMVLLCMMYVLYCKCIVASGVVMVVPPVMLIPTVSSNSDLA